MASPLPRTFEVIRADVTHLSSIDQVSQTFRARLFLILRIAGGADDEHLVKEYDGFPLDTSGVPTFRPSARWYLNQISFSNGRSIETQESKVTVAGNDLQLIKRVEGEFFSRFELHSFPFDAQDLTITISTHCATKGPVPMLYTVPPSSDLGVDTANFAYGDVWELSPSIATEVTTVGATSKRRFCAVHLRACVSRQPNFILLNVVTPMACISLLGVTTFTIDLDDVQDRIAITVALLLTTVSLKYVTSAYVPQISYLTLVDSFVMLNGLLIVFISVAHAVMSLVSNLNSDRDGSSGEDETDKVLKMTDYILLGVAFFLWLSILLRFVVVGKRATNTSSASGQQRESARRRSERLAAKRAQHDVKEELST